jgi:hypothetical protein
MGTSSGRKTAASVGLNERSGVFPCLVDQAAFFDKVVVNVWGLRRKRLAKRIAIENTPAIGGPGRLYARCARGCHSISGNSLQFKYGVLRPYKNLSPFVVTVWAGRAPVTCADLLLVLDSFMRRGYKAVIVAAELTFDTQGIPLSRLTTNLCTTARIFKKVHDRIGRVTAYVGGVRSAWQLRIYQKTSAILRVEFILRSTFLRTSGIREPQQLYFCKKTKLWRHVWFREVDPARGNGSTRRRPWLKRGLGLGPSLRASVDSAPRLVRSECEILLRKMQRNMIW